MIPAGSDEPRSKQQQQQQAEAAQDADPSGPPARKDKPASGGLQPGFSANTAVKSQSDVKSRSKNMLTARDASIDPPDSPSGQRPATVAALPSAPLFVARSLSAGKDPAVKWSKEYQELNPLSTEAQAHQGELHKILQSVLCCR